MSASDEPVPTAATEDSTPEDSTPEDSTPEDSVKAKFREALARKQGHHGGTGEGHAHGGGKAAHTSSSAAHQKEFRRKAGG